MSEFFDKLKIGNLELDNRIVMAPMTRSRANDEGVKRFRLTIMVKEQA